MNFRAAMTTAFPALLGAAILGCGSSSGTGTMNVHLVDGPDTSYKAVTLEVKRLEIHGPNGWQTLADFTIKDPGVLKVNNLLDLQYGLRMTLADSVPLVAGHYDQMRMLLGPNNSVTLENGDWFPLKVPSGMQSGVKFPVSFDISEGTTRDVFIDFDAHRSVFVHQAGASGQYLLRPVVRAIDKPVGSISGTLTVDGVVPAVPLGKVEVMAEVVENGQAVVVRSTFTDATTGQYTLDLLPLGVNYYVVAQPVVSDGTTTTVYPPSRSDLKTITETTPNATWNASFTAAASNAIGTVTGSIAPVAATDQTDAVFVMALFTGEPVPLVVRTVNAALVDDSYTVTDLPLRDGGYILAVERSTTNDGGYTTTTWGPNSAPVLSTNTSTSVNLPLTAQ